MKILSTLALNLFAMFPLQVVGDFSWPKKSDSSRQLIIFLAVFAAVIAVILIINSIRKSAPGGMGANRGGGGSGPGLFSGLALRRAVRDMGLNREQIKMLNYVFKIDDVIDPIKSLGSSDLLDQHFRRAYRAIEQNAATEEEVQRRHALLFSTRNTLEHSGGGNLTSTKQLKEEARLSIGSGKDKHDVAVVSTKGDNLAVGCPKNALGSYIKMQKGTRLTVFYFAKNNNGFSFETRIVGYSGAIGHTTMLLTHSNKIKKLSQRRYRRRQIVVACNMFLVYVEGSGRKQRLVVDKRRLTGNLSDISVGGCSIKSKAPVTVGARMKIEFIQGDINVAALGQVLRTNRAGIITIAHVKFLRVSRKSMNTINAFVYEFANE